MRVTFLEDAGSSLPLLLSQITPEHFKRYLTKNLLRFPLCLFSCNRSLTIIRLDVVDQTDNRFLRREEQRDRLQIIRQMGCLASLLLKSYLGKPMPVINIRY